MSTLFDIATAAVFIAVVWFSYRKGLVRSVIELVGYVASFVVSWIFCAPLGAWIYTNFLKNALYKLVSGYYTAMAAGTQQSIGSMLSQYHINLPPGIAAEAAKSGQSDVDSLIMATVVGPLGQTIGKAVAFILIFLACLVAVKILASLGDVIYKTPPI